MARAGKKLKATAPVPPLRFAPEAWPAGTVEWVDIGWLKPHPRNARTHGERQIQQIVASIAEHGFAKLSIVCDEEGVTLAGHGNVQALKRFGAQVPKVPVTIVRGWSEAQKRAFMLRDNKIAENAGWDREMLEAELAALSGLPDIDLGELGFSQAELDRFLEEPEREGMVPGDQAPELLGEAVPVSRLGDVWQLGEHRLVCGDCTKPDVVAAVLQGQVPLLMVTDPPYGVDYDPNWRNEVDRANGKPIGERAVGTVANDDQSDWRAAWQLFPGDVAYCWHAGRHASSVQASLEAAEFEIRCQIIWAKDNHAISRGDYHWQHEPCWYAVRKGRAGHWAGDRSQTTLWSIPKPVKSETGHGTQKPIECMKRPIVNNSRAGDLVYEPFSGSGTTIIACEMTGRRGRAIELNPAYVDVAVRRWEQFTGKGAILASGGGEGWVAAAAERGVPVAA